MSELKIGNFKFKHELKTHSINRVVVSDDPDAVSGACHRYVVILPVEYQGESKSFFGPAIDFQKGPRHVETSLRGVQEDDLLAVLQDRLESFQKGPFASDFNRRALEGVRLAREALKARIEDRARREVLGFNLP